MTEQQLFELLRNDTPNAKDEQFRGPFQRFCWPASLMLKRLAFGGATDLDKALAKLFAGVDLPCENVTKDQKVIDLRNEGLRSLGKVFGYSDDFMDNVVQSNIAADTRLLTAMLVVRSTALFANGYPSDGCFQKMKKVVSLLRAMELPDGTSEQKAAKD